MQAFVVNLHRGLHIIPEQIPEKADILRRFYEMSIVYVKLFIR